MRPDDARIAYFSMEIALASDVPTYAGGLGVLAGDTIRAAADLRAPMVAVTLLHRKGYFRQTIDEHGRQHELADEWDVASRLTEQSQRIVVHVENREVTIRAWRYDVDVPQDGRGSRGGRPSSAAVHVYLLDADLPENHPQDRRLTDSLYAGDDRYRLSQEIILGIGGVRMLRALGYSSLSRFHMNEGHAALLVLELLHESLVLRQGEHVNESDIEHVRNHCVFTTHTPVPAGHDQFPLHLVHDVVGVFADHVVERCRELCVFDDRLNMTLLALNFSRYVNGVAKKHGEVSQAMFANYAIDWITNGVHGAFWAAEPIAALFDRYTAGWRTDNFMFRYAMNIPVAELWQAHLEAKRSLLQLIRRTSGVDMREDAIMLGFARRVTEYKRHDVLFTDVQRLKGIAREHGPIQVVFAGKAHPSDEFGKGTIRDLVRMQQELDGDVRIAFLPNYDIDMARAIVGGVDVWLNTPMPPQEASGTSGMKAAVNGVPSLSVLDGWWLEGLIEGVTGWSIGDTPEAAAGDRAATASLLYNKLEHSVLPCFYQQRDRFIEMMRSAIAFNGSFFSTHRMLQEYVLKAYLG